MQGKYVKIIEHEENPDLKGIYKVTGETTERYYLEDQECTICIEKKYAEVVKKEQDEKSS